MTDFTRPATAGLMPIKGSGCGVRPDLESMPTDTSFDFSQVSELYAEATTTKATIITPIQPEPLTKTENRS